MPIDSLERISRKSGRSGEGRMAMYERLQEESIMVANVNKEKLI